MWSWFLFLWLLILLFSSECLLTICVTILSLTFWFVSEFVSDLYLLSIFLLFVHFSIQEEVIFMCSKYLFSVCVLPFHSLQSVLWCLEVLYFNAVKSINMSFTVIFLCAIFKKTFSGPSSEGNFSVFLFKSLNILFLKFRL